MFNQTSFVILILILVVSVTAQTQVSIGARGGVGLYVISGIQDVARKELTITGKKNTSFQAAIPINIPLSKNFSLQPELQYVKKGAAYDARVDGVYISSNLSLNYLAFPILLKRSFDVKGIKLGMFAGPDLGFALSKKVLVERENEAPMEMPLTFNENNNFKETILDFAIDFGIDFAFLAGIGSVVFDARYSLDLNDHVVAFHGKPEDWTCAYNRGFNFSLGYVVPLGK